MHEIFPRVRFVENFFENFFYTKVEFFTSQNFIETSRNFTFSNKKLFHPENVNVKYPRVKDLL